LSCRRPLFGSWSEVFYQKPQWDISAAAGKISGCPCPQGAEKGYLAGGVEERGLDMLETIGM